MLRRKWQRQKPRTPVAAALPVGTALTFRAEVMPGKDSLDRTVHVTKVLANGRIELKELEGQHSLAEFERQ